MRQTGADRSILRHERPRTEHGGLIATRWSTAADDRGLAEVHREAWRYAYAGIIPG